MNQYVPSQEELIIQHALQNAYAKKSAPVRSASGQITIEGFGPYLSSGTWRFNRGMRFVTPPTRPEADMLAVATGALTFIPAAGSAEPPLLALFMSSTDVPCLLMSGMPSWMPPPRYVFYRGADPASVQAAIQTLLTNDPRRLTSAQKAYKPVASTALPTASTLAQAFVSNPASFPGGIPVLAGEMIGCGAISGGTSRAFELMFCQALGSMRLTQNPAFYFNFWRLAGLLDLTNHPNATRLLRLEHGIQANSVLRFVSQTGNNANIPYTNANQPALTLSAALSTCDNGDTIVILDAATYQEAEYVITKAVNITSAASLDAGQPHLGGTVTDSGHPTVPTNLPTLQGPESYAGIKEDMTNDETHFPTTNAHRVFRFSVDAGAGIASVSKVIIRYGGAREGAGIYVYRSDPVAIISCHIYRNIAYFNALHFVKIPPHGGMPHPFPGSGWFEEGSGGGVGIYRSSPLIWGNLIERNLANYGGAIGLFASCYPLIAENYMYRNAGPEWFRIAGIGVTVTDGGAIRVLQQSLRYDSQATLQAAVTAGTKDNPVLIPINQMYDPAEVAQTRTRWIHLRSNCILENVAADDGGGIYGTALSRFFSSYNIVSRNTARRGDGGGFRISTASVLRSISDKVTQNQVLGPANKEATGGGIAVRCASLHLRGTKVEGNTSHFAGAGISFTSTREGEVSDGGTAQELGYRIPSWDDQRRLGLGFNHTYLEIEGTTLISANQADDTSHGKGGGLYVFRFEDAKASFAGDKLTFLLEKSLSVITPTNDSAFVSSGTKKPYRLICLMDQTKQGASGKKPLIIGDAELTAAGTDFFHESL